MVRNTEQSCRSAEEKLRAAAEELRAAAHEAERAAEDVPMRRYPNPAFVPQAGGECLFCLIREQNLLLGRLLEEECRQNLLLQQLQEGQGALATALLAGREGP